MKTRYVIFIVSLILLTACGLASPPETPVVREPEPTPTPLPTQTSVPADFLEATQLALGTQPIVCDDYSFDPATVDITIPEGTVMKPGQEFVKTWRIRNTGACDWDDDYILIYAYGDKMSGKSEPISLTKAGQEVEVSVNFKAPTTIGEYVSVWQMANANGIPFGTKENILIVRIIIQ